MDREVGGEIVMAYGQRGEMERGVCKAGWSRGG